MLNYGFADLTDEKDHQSLTHDMLALAKQNNMWKVHEIRNVIRRLGHKKEFVRAR